MQKRSQKTQGIVYVLIAAFGFSLMSMFVKLAGDLPSFEKAFFRNFVALIFIVILMLRSRTSFRPERRNLPALFGRCFFGTLGLLCNFYAIGRLNLPDANMLNKLSPFFAIVFSIFLLREKPNLVQMLGVLVAFGGSVCIIKPSFDNPQALPALARRDVSAAWFPCRTDRLRAAPGRPANDRHPAPPASSADVRTTSAWRCS